MAIFQKIFSIDNSEGKEYVRISSIPRFNFFFNITLVIIHQLSPEVSLNDLSKEYISSQLLNNNSSDKSFFDVPITTGLFEVDVHITTDIGKGVQDIACRLIGKAEHTV